MTSSSIKEDTRFLLVPCFARGENTGGGFGRSTSPAFGQAAERMPVMSVPIRPCRYDVTEEEFRGASRVSTPGGSNSQISGSSQASSQRSFHQMIIFGGSARPSDTRNQNLNNLQEQDVMPAVVKRQLNKFLTARPVVHSRYCAVTTVRYQLDGSRRLGTGAHQLVVFSPEAIELP